MNSSAELVKKRLYALFELKIEQIKEIAEDYAQRCEDEFTTMQRTGQGVIGRYWHNRTNKAEEGVFHTVGQDDTDIFWRLAHTEHYGIFLELTNDRQNEALRPLVQKWGELFLLKIRLLFGENVVSSLSHGVTP